MSARAIMVLGCTSGAGKSWLATALCRLYARRGLRVAPFKAQNMSNHARVVALREGGAGKLGDGKLGEGEIGSAQYFQALAAGVTPDVRMNPVLLKPESDTRSQVVLMGKVREDLRSRAWRERSEELWTAARAAYLSLASEYDLIILEGAGSPAEINLASSDFVNTRSALLAEAACLLVADIDRGGAFAHLFGTHQLMDPGVRALVRGFVLNRFRGDASLLAPGPANLEAMTGVSTVAVIPMVRDHGVPEEDAVPRDSDERAIGPRFVVVAAPHASNLEEFEPLRAAGVHLAFVRDARGVESADWLILPGSKQTRADLAWLKERGMEGAIRAHIAAQRPVLAICGGMQLLGERLDDPEGLEGAPAGEERGLGVLPLVTRFVSEKRVSRTPARFGALEGAWRRLSNLDVLGYEIHVGRTTAAEVSSAQTVPSLAVPSVGSRLVLNAALVSKPEGVVVGWQFGSILGVYCHGLLENPAVLDALTGATTHTPESAFDTVADVVERSFTLGFLDSLVSRK